jgi:GT2 family glycosyltransferase
VTPDVAVVIPTRRPAATIARCLEAVVGQAGPALEVVVVDDGSPDPAELDRLAAAAGSVRVLHRPHRGVSAARNAGAATATAALVAFTDDDCAPEPGWLAGLVDVVGGRDDVVAGGRVVNGVPGNRYAEASQLVLDLAYGYYDGRAGRPALFAANNLALPAALLTRVGGFDEALAFGEDRELDERLRAAGAEFVFAPSAVVRHEKDLDATGFVRQFFGYGRGSYRYHAAGPGRVGATAGFYRRLPRALRGAPPSTLALLGLWQAANLAGFAWEAGVDAVSRRRG